MLFGLSSVTISVWKWLVIYPILFFLWLCIYHAIFFKLVDFLKKVTDIGNNKRKY